MNSTATTTRGYQATAGVAARSRWTAADALVGSHHALAAIEPMPSIFVVKNHKGIRHRPPEDSN